MIHFVGAGPGAPDLITLRGAKLLGEAGMIIYAGSLVNKELLARAAELEGVRVVVSAVTLKTFRIASVILGGETFRDFDAVQINVSKMKKLGESEVMTAQNPVAIFSATARGALREG